MKSVAESSTGGGGLRLASADLAAIASLDRQECIRRWLGEFGQLPPKYVSVQFMRRALAFEDQVKRQGGHSTAVQKALAATLKGGAPGKGRASYEAWPAQLRPGTHLVREWNGRSYQVEVLDDGFRMDGKTYRSLTAIARRITGAHWSGPRFFGLG